MPRHRHRRPLAVVVGLALATPLLLLAPPASAAPVVPAKPYDFNGDGFPELAAGVSSLDVGQVREAGGVVVLPSSRSGLSTAAHVITQATPGVPGAPQDTGFWGASVASGDFDRDGYADLAVSSGSVTVLYGSASGLTGSRAVLLDPPASTGGLVVGDFDGDGWPDLAVGESDSEQVQVFRGGPSGLAVARSTVVRGKAGSDVYFGSALGAGDLNGDGRDDLVVGSEGPGFPDDEGYSGPGSISACFGATGGPTTCTQLVHDLRYAGNQSIVVGNVSGDARPEIVFGVPYTYLQFGPVSARAARDGGVVEILSLSGRGAATTATAVEVSQDSAGVRGTNEADDEFGAAVALADLDQDGYADLVIGAPGEDVGKHEDAGRVTIVYGGRRGYRTSGGKIYDQATKGIRGKPGRRHGFGAAVTLLDHDDDGRLDLDVGVPGEDDGSRYAFDGAITTLRGSGKAFTTKRSRTLTPSGLGIVDDGGEELGSELGR